MTKIDQSISQRPQFSGETISNAKPARVTFNRSYVMRLVATGETDDNGQTHLPDVVYVQKAGGV